MATTSALKTPSTSSTTKRTRIYTLEDVRHHSKSGNCWVVHDNKIYDVTTFIEDHPGGDDLILEYAGRDITTVMSDPLEHSHSDSAFSLLQSYQVGVVGAEERITNVNFVFTDHFKPQDTDNGDDWERNQFLDLDRPLVMQMWNSDFSKSFYLQQVHQPRHLPHPARLFGPSYLEMFTRTPWYVVPLIWVPITLYILYLSVSQQLDKGTEWGTAWARTGACFLLGNFIWTLLEYTMHRFVFHIEEYLPDRPFFLMLHFLLHGIHHYLPMDGLRLVMPPILFTVLQAPFTKLGHLLFPPFMANGIIAGAFAFYVAYDMAHYFFHHASLPGFLKSQKSYHMEHHYKEPNLGFGVTSPVWDWVFDTEFVSAPKAKKAVQ
ncbi:inositolphosphorylceramide-B C-26 hydroxylase [Leucosporidium creatinivorum]|uniref:Ceramide very long chain fatty acid hydroxylase n=1 Tax=Leucosporidium creatinivorum TaxID=106004 RepID=A0A1Y2EUE7_9BASI|nr:inositolphosphorylceramide-B C-26 hydroxylase [Leucosporidium creatinivorum]